LTCNKSESWRLSEEVNSSSSEILVSMDIVGLFEGSMLGIAVGLSDGEDVGSVVGDVEGFLVGKDEG